MNAFFQLALQAPASDIDSFSDLVINKFLAQRNIPFSQHSVESRSELVVAGGSCFYLYFGLMKMLSENGGKIITPQGTFDGLNAVPAPYNLETVVLGTEDTRYKLTAAQLSRYLENEDTGQIAAVIITNPLNPIGTYYEPAEAMEIIAICYEHNILPIIDEHFLGLSFNPNTQDSSLLSHSFRASDGTIIKAFDVCVGVCGTTKYLGIEEYRAGFAYSGNTELLSELRGIVIDQGADLNRGEEILLIKAIKSDRKAEDRLELKNKLNLVESLVRDINSVCGSNVVKLVDIPEGGIFACLSFDNSLCESVGITSDYHLFIYLLEAAGVEVRSLHGNTFNSKSGRYARINISMPSEDKLKEAFSRIQTVCSSLTTGDAEQFIDVSERFFNRIKDTQAFKSISNSKNAATQKALKIRQKQQKKNKKIRIQEPVNSEAEAIKVVRGTFRNNRSFIEVIASLSSSANFTKQRGRRDHFSPDLSVEQTRLTGNLIRLLRTDFEEHLKARFEQ